MTSESKLQSKSDLVGRHIRFGWGQILLFLMLGVVLEAMHGFKIGWYLNAGEETRRMLLTLAHAHGILLGIVNIAYGLTLRGLPGMASASGRFESPLLMTASMMMPSGFLLGGLVTYGGDPGFGIFLVGPGAAMLVVAVGMIFRATRQARS
jgi:hypothetical protein